MTSVKVATLAGTRAERTVLATAGERLVLEHIRFSVVQKARTIFEIETLQITEVGTDGQHRRAGQLRRRRSPRRQRGAARALLPRRGRRDLTPPGAIEHFRAWHDQDLARLRATLPDGFWFHDHRRTGVGRIDGADAYIDSVAALFEQVRDINAVALYHVALEAHGSLAIAHNFGTALGGGAVESVFVRLSFYRDGEYAALELFELEDLEQARERFEELRPDAAQPDPLRIPPNAATRVADRWHGVRGGGRLGWPAGAAARRSCSKIVVLSAAPAVTATWSSPTPG